MPESKDVIHSLVKKVFSYNRYLMLALVVGLTWNIAGGAWFESKIISPLSGKEVTAQELIAERNAYVTAIEATVAQNDQKIARHVLEAELLQKANADKVGELEGVEASTDAGIQAIRAEQERLRGLLSTLLTMGTTAYPPAAVLLPFKDDLLTLVVGGLYMDGRRRSKLLANGNGSSITT